MILKPLGDRVLIRPLAQPETSESGLIQIVEDKKPDEIGVVVAVGTPVHPKRDAACVLADYMETYKAFELYADFVRDLVRREPCVKVGDTVLFSWVSGQELTLNDGDERYLLMRESDLLAVVEDVE